MALELDGRSVLVTGSSSGLGNGCARAFAREGANVSICGRDPDRLADARAALEDEGPGDVIAHSVDLTDPDEVSHLVDETAEAFGGIDHLVTSAGGPPRTTFLETSERQWYEAYDLLVMSVVWTIENAHPHLLESDAGSVVCITSWTVREVVEGLLLSNAVRRAVIGLVKSISREFAPEIRANAVLPGPIETGRLQEVIEEGVELGNYDDYEDGLANMTEDVPMDRLGDPLELGEVVAFLSSERASFVTGAEIPIDGGLLRS